MQEKKIKFTDVLFVGLAFFASYFGAGNLIFPPMLGLQSGSNWLSGMIGMLASGVGLPILAIIVLGMCGSVQKISDHVNKKFYTVMIGAIMIPEMVNRGYSKDFSCALTAAAGSIGPIIPPSVLRWAFRASGPAHRIWCSSSSTLPSRSCSLRTAVPLWTMWARF